MRKPSHAERNQLVLNIHPHKPPATLQPPSLGLSYHWASHSGSGCLCWFSHLFLHLGQDRTRGKQPANCIQPHQLGHANLLQAAAEVKTLAATFKQHYLCHWCVKALFPSTRKVTTLSSDIWLQSSCNQMEQHLDSCLLMMSNNNASAHQRGHWSLLKFRSWTTWHKLTHCFLCNYSPLAPYSYPVH